MRINMHDAKSNLSRLVERAAAGERIEIARAGQPIAMLVPYTPERPRKRLGVCAGQAFAIAEDFDDLPDDIAQALGGWTLVTHDDSLRAYGAPILVA